VTAGTNYIILTATLFILCGLGFLELFLFFLLLDFLNIAAIRKTMPEMPAVLREPRNLS